MLKQTLVLTALTLGQVPTVTDSDTFMNAATAPGSFNPTTAATHAIGKMDAALETQLHEINPPRRNNPNRSAVCAGRGHDRAAASANKDPRHRRSRAGSNLHPLGSNLFL